MLFSFSAFLYGLPVGFAFSFALGPVFFSLIKASLEYGFRAAISIALGVIAADLVLLGIAYGGVEAFLPKSDMDVTFWVQLLGGLLLVGIGLATMLKKRENTEGVALTHERRIIKHLSMGFFLNIINPANFFEWVGAASVLKSKYQFETFENVSFFTGALLAVFITELSVAYFATRLRKVLNDRVIYGINVATGVVFIGSGIWLLLEAMK
jgi:threonine/homoserine/homoserine lactone efflux protein